MLLLFYFAVFLSQRQREWQTQTIHMSLFSNRLNLYSQQEEKFNLAFSSKFRSVEWTGNQLTSYCLDFYGTWNRRNLNSERNSHQSETNPLFHIPLCIKLTEFIYTSIDGNAFPFLNQFLERLEFSLLFHKVNCKCLHK